MTDLKVSGLPSAPTPQTLAELERTAADRRMSPLVLWMARNYERMEAVIRVDRPSWDAIAAYLDAIGLRDAKGRPPTRITASQAWYRVDRAVSHATHGQVPRSVTLASLQR